MKIGPDQCSSERDRVVVLSADQGFLGELNAAFGQRSDGSHARSRLA